MNFNFWELGTRGKERDLGVLFFYGLLVILFHARV